MMLVRVGMMQIEVPEFRDRPGGFKFQRDEIVRTINEHNDRVSSGEPAIAPGSI